MNMHTEYVLHKQTLMKLRSRNFSTMEYGVGSGQVYPKRCALTGVTPSFDCIASRFTVKERGPPLAPLLLLRLSFL